MTSAAKTHRLPTISLAIPNWNGDRWLDECLDSVCSQGYSGLELIFVDGGSTDRSLEIAEGYKKHLNLIISEPDDGPADAINKALRVATGEVFHWLNSDDMLETGALRLVGAGFRSNPNAVCIAGHVYNCDSVMENVLGIETNDGLDYSSFFRYCCGLTELQWHQPGCWWRRDAYLRCGFFDARFRALFDRDYYLRLLRAGPLIHNIGMPLVRFRFHESNISRGYPSWKALEASRVLMKAVQLDSSLLSDYELFRRNAYWSYRLQKYSRGRAGFSSAARLISETLVDPTVRLRPHFGLKKVFIDMLKTRCRLPG